jgi:hypothetical protein
MKRPVQNVARAYIACASIASLLVAWLLLRWPLPAASLVTFVVIAALGCLAHAYPIQGFRHQAYQVTLPLIVLAAACFNGVELVAFIVAIHVAEQARIRRPFYIQWFNGCNYFLSAALALVLFHRALALLPSGAVGELSAALAAACSFILLNRVLLAGALWLARGLSPLASGLFQPELLAADLVIAWVAGPMLVLALQMGSWTALVTAGPLLLARPALSALLRRYQQATGQVEAPAA